MIKWFDAMRGIKAEKGGNRPFLHVDLNFSLPKTGLARVALLEGGLGMNGFGVTLASGG